MLKVAISGNIGSGKTEVQKILNEMKYKTLCTDEVSHILLNDDDDVKNEIIKEFETTDRKTLAKIVFNDKEKRDILENIIHKKIKDKIFEFFKDNKDEKATFVFIPLLFEAHFEDFFDKIVFISADENIRLKRILSRPDYDFDMAKKRIDSQTKEETKIKKSDIIIKNEGTIEELKENITNMLNKLHIL